MVKSLKDIFENKTVTLVGAGISNTPLAEVISPLCKSISVRDKKPLSDWGEARGIFESYGCAMIDGEGYLDDLTEDIIIRSPGIRPDIPPFCEAVERGAILTSEMELFLSLERCPIYAITGSDGKSTTTTITSLLLHPAGDVFLGGNIGKPLLNRYEQIHENDAVAVELSSFQLMRMDAPVKVAAITNITPNHLNWHTGMDEYIEAKKRILLNAERAVLNYDNDATREIGREMQATDTPVTYFSLRGVPKDELRPIDSRVWLEDGVIYTDFSEEGVVELLSRDDIRLPGEHNVANYMTAIAVTHGATTPEKIRVIARSFGGVEHRLEFVRELGGVRYINGSIDSSPTRTAAALSALSGVPVVLIAGGYDKNIPYEPLADAIMESTVHTVVLTGATAEKINAAITSHPAYDPEGLTIIREDDFDSAIHAARDHAKAGDTVILSPASASFDHFKNFEERGRHYKDIVNSF